MKQNNIKFYTYPGGPAESMGQDEIVLHQNSIGGLDNKYVGDLFEGDLYSMRELDPLPPRNADDILHYIAKNKISFNYLKDEMGRVVAFEAHKDGLIICQMEYLKLKTIIRNVIEPVMDMEEL